MILASIQEMALAHWKDAMEILILAVGIYYAYTGLRGTRGLRVLTGLGSLVLGLCCSRSFSGLR